MKNCINTRKRKIIFLSSVSVLLVIIIVSVVVGITINNKNKNGGGNNNPINHHEYKGQFTKKGENGFIELVKLSIPKNGGNLQGKTLTVKNGSINGMGATSSKFSGNLKTEINFTIKAQGITVKFGLKENPPQTQLILTVHVAGGGLDSAPYYDLPLS